jgi:hypothetical protein
MRALAPLFLVLSASLAIAQPVRPLQEDVDARYPSMDGSTSPEFLAGRLAASGVQDTPWTPSPRGALLRSLAIPGWGQIYNRQPLKAPVIWAGLGTLVGVTIYSNDRTILFRRAALFDDCLNRPENVPAAACTDFEQFADEFARADGLTAGPLNATSARSLRDQFRRQRDLFVLLSTLAYGLQALDAFVAAELADFDTGEDLMVGLAPSSPMPRFVVRLRL